MDPVWELQTAIYARLSQNAALTTLMGADKVYDNPPADPNGNIPAATYPYVSFGSASSSDDSADCVDAVDVTFQINCWSSLPSQKQVRQIADAVTKALRRWEPPLAMNALVTFDYWRTDYIRAPGINQASIQYTAVIETP